MKTVSIMAILAALGAAAPAVAATKAPKPKLSMAEARAIALKTAPGKIKDAEYEREGGGWRYSFDIVQGGKIHEIGVDAMTGKIVEDKYEAPGDKD
jgi:uncharacterized membrane protein YkoI